MAEERHHGGGGFLKSCELAPVTEQGDKGSGAMERLDATTIVMASNRFGVFVCEQQQDDYV